MEALEPLAIIGLSCHFPGGATSEDAFWDMLMNKECAASELPKDRYNIEGFYCSNAQQPSTVKSRNGHYLKDDMRNFDASFFSIAATEASSLDPQQRGIMETTYHALENAGLAMGDVAGSKTSVHIGCFSSDYWIFNSRDDQKIPKYNASGTSQAMLSNRVSWFFDLRGPSMTIDTACSSGMVALHLGCQGLWSGETKLAVVGAANVILTPEMDISLSNMGFVSRDGRCYSFDSRANGYGRGEGFGALIIKPLASAISDRDPIRALIRSVGSNQDGHTNGGITQPSREMQAQLIRDTYRKAGLDMSLTRFFEAHGTGTPLGDPTEAHAIGESFSRYRTPEEPLYVGAVKSNIGHLEGASGLAGIIKAVLSIEKGVVPPNANFETLNPDIDDEFFNLNFPVTALKWPETKSGIRRASVNSFGFGGANAHVVLDDPYSYIRMHGLLEKAQGCLTFPDIPSPDFKTILSNGHTERPIVNGHVNGPKSDDVEATHLPQLLLFSSSDESGIKRLARKHSEWFDSQGDSITERTITNYSHTLTRRGSTLPWRSYCVITSLGQLTNIKSAISTPKKIVGPNKNLGLVFTGQGAQWLGMGKELFANPTFKRSVEKSQEYVKSHLGSDLDIKSMLKGQVGKLSIHEARFSQILTTCLQIALVDLFVDLGVEPSVVVGHSSGEIAAAYCNGLISHSSAVKVSFYRGLLCSKIEEGGGPRWSMAAIGLSAKDASFEIDCFHEASSNPENATLVISCINSFSSVTVSGHENQLEPFIESLASRKIFARQLRVKLGYHSEQMKQVAGEYGKLIGRLEQGHARRSIMVSSVTGTPVDGPSLLGPQYWVQNMVQPVRFLDAMQHCSKRSDQDTVAKKLDQSHQGDIVVHGWLEIGPHSVLKGPIRQILETFRKPGEVAYTSALIRDQSGLESVLSAAGQLHCLNFHTDVKKAVCLAFHSPHRKVLTSVPSYPFDHSTLHWEEPKASQDYRFRPRGSLPFLGLRINSSGGNTNSLESEWKLLINNDTMPWVNDHKVNNSILYPAAGMLVMVIEAVKEISAQVPVGFELYNVEFPAPIVVGPNTEGTEVHLHLSQMTKERNSNQRFRILVHKGDGSIELVCQGTARAVMDSDTADLDEKDRKDQRLRERQERHIKASQQCFHEIDNVEMYKTLRNHLGLDYGPAFQVLTDIRSDQHNQAVAIVSNYHEDSESLPVVHPSRLDGVFQLAFAAISTTRDPRTMIPTRVGKLFVSSRGFGHGPEGRDKAFTKSRSLLPRCARFDITVVSEDYKYIKSSIEDLEVRAISSDPRAPATLDEAPYSCSKMVWEPALDMLNQEETLHYCEIRRPKYEEPDKFLNDVRAATTVFGIRALRNVAGGEKVAVEMEQYYTWLQTHLGSHVEDEVSGQELEEIMSRIQSTVRGQLHIDVGQNLTDILCGRRDPLQLLFHEEERVGHFYQEMVQDSSAFAVFGRYLHSLVHQTPNLRFLEIGGGTGSTTEEILKVVQSRFKEYIFTDISPFFFEKAETRFKKKKMSYSVLDIENDPCSQGFEQSNYDIIIADNVLHTTADLMKTLANVRKLLRPGGKLILKELVQPDDLLTGFVFGLLPGWWHGSEEFRILSPVVIETKWDELLRHAGFSGVDLVFRDHKGDSSHQWSIMIASHNQVQDQSSPGQTPVVIIADPSSLFQGAITAGLNRRLGTGQAVEEISLIKAAQASQERNLDFIALVETERPLVAEINEEAFLALQSITQNARSLVWVTKGGSHWTPGFSATNGLFRVLRNEKKSVPIISVALELAHDSSPERPPDHIKNVFHQLQQAIKNGTEYEPEYTELEGRLCVNRLIRATALDEHIFTESSRPVLPQEIGDRTLKLGIRVPGLLDTLEWSTDSLDDGPILPDEIQVEVRAIGVNFKDCLTLLGRVDTDRLGGECAGFVTGIGSNISEFNIGDRVVVGGIDSYKTVVRTYNENTMRIPETMSFPQAASIPVTFCTAYYSLVEMARLKKGETVLISAAAGGTGQAALQIAQHIGAEIFATVGSESKKKDLMEEYGISEDHILFSRNDRFIDTIWEKTNGRGVDVVLNSATGRLLTASWECIASFGRFVDIGLRDAISHGSLPMGPFSRSATFSAVDLSMIMRAQHGLGKSVLGKVMDLFRDGKLRTASPLHIFGVEDGEDAMRFLQGGKSSGKIALEVNRSAVVPTVISGNRSLTLRDDATYVIAGGLGGLGLSIAQWFFDRGARNLILLSRSGPEGNVKAERVIQSLRSSGMRVFCPRCDITDTGSLHKVFAECSKTMHPIRGCVQAAMVLRDKLFHDMSFEDWRASTNPKIQGSWNLHTTLPSDLDFFIMLSSVCGIFGNAGQSNYAAGNTFQDALARYRVAKGQKSLAMDVGAVLSEGFVAENKDVMDRLLRLNLLQPNTMSEVFAIMDFVMSSPTLAADPAMAQVVMGLLLPAEIMARGLDVPLALKDPLFRHIHAADVTGKSVQGSNRQEKTFKTDFAEVFSIEKAGLVVTEALQSKISRVTGIAAAQIKTGDSLATYGIDSLVAVELKNWLEGEFSADIAVFEILGGATLEDIGMTTATRTTLQCKWQMQKVNGA